MLFHLEVILFVNAVIQGFEAKFANLPLQDELAILLGMADGSDLSFNDVTNFLGVLHFQR